jgi:putative membrane protein
LIVFGLGVLTGIISFVRLIKKCLANYRSQTIYTIVGMMIGSLYSIVQGPTTLSEPQSAMTFGTFNILFFIIGILILVILQVLRFFTKKSEN